MWVHVSDHCCLPPMQESIVQGMVESFSQHMDRKQRIKEGVMQQDVPFRAMPRVIHFFQSNATS